MGEVAAGAATKYKAAIGDKWQQSQQLEERWRRQQRQQRWQQARQGSRWGTKDGSIDNTDGSRGTKDGSKLSRDTRDGKT